MTALVLAGGELKPTPELVARAREAEFVVAADSGLRHATTLGVTPDIILGDFDSVSAQDLAAFARVAKKQVSADKDELDLELALAHAIKQGASKLVLLGVLGGRFDQSLAAVFIAARLTAEGRTVTLHSGVTDVYPLAGPVTRTLELPAGQRFSLLSIKETCLSVSGATYELDRSLLTFGTGRGVSNRALGPIKITVHSGLCALVVDYD